MKTLRLDNRLSHNQASFLLLAGENNCFKVHQAPKKLFAEKNPLVIRLTYLGEKIFELG